MTATSLVAGDARKELYAIMRRESPFEEKVQCALELGKRYLGVENGHFTRIDKETSHWEALVSTDPPDGQFPPGLELDLSTTYCRRTIESLSPIALSNTAEQGWEDDPAFQEHGLHCYHGTTLVLNDKPYGTVCFVKEEPRSAAFSEAESMFAELITRLLERELEHEQHEAQLTRQSNLATVLNRVLRHNIRNDMAIIRGFTQLMKEEGGNEYYAEKTLKEIDDLLALSDKARELERIIGMAGDRQQINLGTLAEQCVEELRPEFPSATFQTEIGDNVDAAVFPTFERAIEELIENAAKHAGSSPIVEISVERVPNAVRIQIADDGPGLSSQDQAVFTTGVETPLIHGSGLGLWIVHWIVTTHGGSTEVSASKDGTTMTISVPHGPEVDHVETIADIQRARDRYEAAFDEAMDAMVVFNDDAKILDANPQSQKIFGLDRQELLGLSIPEFLPDDFDFEGAWKAFKDGGAIDTAEFIRVDGESRAVEYTAKPNIIPGQHFAIYRDITEQIALADELEEERRLAASIMDTIPDPMYVIGTDGYPTYWNKQVEHVTGYTTDEIDDMYVTDFVPEDEIGKISDAFQTVIEDGKQVSVVSAFETKDGKRIPYEFTGAPLEAADGSFRGLTGVGRRLSKRVPHLPGLSDLSSDV